MLHAVAGTSLWSTRFVASIVVVMAFHAAANLFNTYYDYVHGVDTTEYADDRALVDKTIAPDTVWRSAAAFLAVGAGTAGFLTYHAGTAVLTIAGPAAVLAVCYTANPFSLKARGLGDLCIFAMFGPMLAAGTCIATVGAVVVPAMLYSVPQGLLTVAILHANNARDVKADARAGVTTLAMLLGPQRSEVYFNVLIAAAYVSVAGLAVGLDTSVRQIFLLCCTPWVRHTCHDYKYLHLHPHK